MLQLLIEAFAVGIILLLIYVPCMHVLNGIYKDECFGKHKMAHYITIVVVGMIVHLVCEFGGINKWYCTNGNACLIKNKTVDMSHPATW